MADGEKADAAFTVAWELVLARAKMILNHLRTVYADLATRGCRQRHSLVRS
jgi:hypothetical protein